MKKEKIKKSIYLLASKDPNKSKTAEKFLIKLSKKDKNVIITLLDFLKHNNPRIRYRVAHVLGELHNRLAAPMLLYTALKDPNPEVRYDAFVALGKTANESMIPVLLRLLEEELDEGIRSAILGAIIDIVRRCKKAVQLIQQPIIALLEHHDPLLRNDVVCMIGKLGQKEFVKILKKYLFKGDKIFRIHLAEALAEIAIKTRDKGTIQVLRLMLSDSDPEVREIVSYWINQLSAN
jgi:HEAT repeat protein